MTDPTFMSASDLRREVVRLREGIRRHLLTINPDGSHRFAMEADVELWQLVGESDG